MARLFSTAYQICYVYHTDTGDPHIHFCVLTTSYQPEHLPLDEIMFKGYFSKMKAHVENEFQITLGSIWKEAYA